MKSILDKISEKSTFKEIQEYIKQSNCCTRSSRHDYDKFIPVFAHLVTLGQINFQREFDSKLSNSQIHTLQKISLDLKIIEPTVTLGLYNVLVQRHEIDDFRDLVDLFYMKQNEKMTQSKVIEVDSVDGQTVKPKRKYIRKNIVSEDNPNTVVLGKTHLHKLFDMVYYFDVETMCVWYCKITAVSYELISETLPDNEKRAILLRLECPVNDASGDTSKTTKVFQHIKSSDVRLTEEEIKSYILGKIKIVK